VGMFKKVDIIPVAIMMTIVSCIALLILFIGRRRVLAGSLQ
jgi:hypothetical protein